MSASSSPSSPATLSVSVAPATGTMSPAAGLGWRRRCSMALLALACAAPAAWADRSTDFFRSVQLDHDRTVLSQLLAGVDANLREPQRGDTALILALREDADKVFTLLVGLAGTDLEARADNGDTALMIAAYRHKLAAVQALLARGAHVNQPGWTALHYAAASGDEAIARLLLAQGAERDARSPNRMTPLMLAAREGQDRTVRLLLADGADPTLTSAEGMTALQFAQFAAKPYIVDILAAHLKSQSRQ